MKFDDKAFLLDPDRWPGPYPCMKTRPGVKPRLFGFFIPPFDPAKTKPGVLVTDGASDTVRETELFDDLDTLLVRWMVD